MSTDLDRRELFRLLGAGVAHLGLGACMERPRERILPWVHRPEGLQPGEPVAYATALTLDGFATGLIGHCIDARPIKIEGNPDHPSSLGATSPQDQAAVLELYDPDRARAPLERGAPTTWRRIRRGLAGARRPWIVMPPQSSPAIAALLDRLRAVYDDVGVVMQSPLGRRAAYRGAEQVFGRPLEIVADLSRADVVVSLDADLVAGMPGALRHARDLARRRQPGGSMSRLYVAEPAPTPTGSLADHRLPLPSRQIAALAAQIASGLAGRGHPAPGELDAALRGAPGLEHHRVWIDAVIDELAAHPGASAVIAGDHQEPAVHALALLINLALKNVGETIRLTEPALLDPGGPTVSDLIEAIEAGAVDALVIADSDPASWAPELAPLLGRIDRSLHLSRYREPTSGHCRWFTPLAHPLEQWSDGRGHDGTVTLAQPLCRPLFDGVGLLELLIELTGATGPSPRTLLAAHHRAGGDWDEWLRAGLIPGTEAPPASAEPRPELSAIETALAAGRSDSGIEIDRVRSHAIHDGRFSRSAWLQELPAPITKLTWGNALQMSPATADRLGLEDGQIARVEIGERHLEAPAQIVAGHADGALTLAIGYGREVGVDAFALGGGPLALDGARVTATGRRVELAVTQGHQRQHHRDLALEASLADFRDDPERFAHHRGELPSLFDPQPLDPPQWAMTIDTSVCSGCSACVIACQVENNVPAVGRAGVLANREMHWLRIDTYLDDRDEPIHQPMACQHCEAAPCEYVCPTFATVHSPDGLNEMVYNRCVGTRFCSNNCPYKVRRFNWFDYTEPADELRQLGRNPQVTVRGRGVMEKCTYCVQRIRNAEIDARMQDREIEPGEVVTACQQACPTSAIQFGALHHEGTPMVEMRADKRAYAVLHREGTRPRTMYLARIRNLNPAIDT